jgi:hypothetical protein
MKRLILIPYGEKGGDFGGVLAGKRGWKGEKMNFFL